MSAISTLLYALVVAVDTQLLNEVLDLVRNVDNDALLQQLKQDLKSNCATTNESQAHAKQLFQRATTALGNGTASRAVWDEGHAALRAVMRFDERAAQNHVQQLPPLVPLAQSTVAATVDGGAVADASQHGIHTAGAQAIDRMPLVLSATGRRGHFERELPCARPTVGAHRAFDGALLAQELEHGRVCTRGGCSATCKLVVSDGIVSDEEAVRLIRHARVVASKAQNRDGDGKALVDLSRSAKHAEEMSEHLLYMRVVERVRRLVAMSFGLSLASVTVASHFISHIDAEGEEGAASADGGKGAATTHADESSFARFHYSAVLWLNTMDNGVNNGASNGTFQGGAVRFWKPSPAMMRGENSSTAKKEQWLTVEPRAGRLALFSSGWENVHQVQKVVSGERFSLPIFFSTQRNKRFGRACVHPRSAKHWDHCEEVWPLWWA